LGFVSDTVAGFTRALSNWKAEVIGTVTVAKRSPPGTFDFKFISSQVATNTTEFRLAS